MSIRDADGAANRVAFIGFRDSELVALNGIRVSLALRISIPTCFMDFRIIDRIRSQRSFARGRQIREWRRLERAYGPGRWRKRKGIARVELADGSTHWAELHWYEAPGIGRKEFKIKRLLA